MQTAPKVAAYEAFAGRLRGDLAAIEARQREAEASAAAYRELAQSAAERQAHAGAAAGEPTRLLVDLGCEVQCAAEVAADALCFVDVGLGFRVGMTAEELQDFCPRRAEVFDQRARAHAAEAADVRAHLRLVAEGVRELSGVEGQAATEPMPRGAF